MESFSRPHLSSQRNLTSSDWSHLRTIITNLYQCQRLTMNQVRHHLNVAGFRVTTRMVRARITQWNLHRNHQLRDMVAALRLLDLDPKLWPSPQPCFLVRGRPVAMKKVVLYFRRKGIQDPLQWAHSEAVDCGLPHVTLLDCDPQSAGGPANHPEQRAQDQGADLPVPLQYHLTKTPMMFDETAVTGLQAYCSAYIGLGNIGNQEPAVHQFTIHGQFGERIRDGLAHMIRNDPEAFPNLHRGFDLVHSLLSGCHPMALAQYLAVICDLASCQAHSILSSLRRYVAGMASALGLSESVTGFLSAVHSSQNVLNTVILCLRAAVGAFGGQHSFSWQKFYLQERLCDCLYYEGIAGLFMSALFAHLKKRIIATSLNTDLD